MGKSATLKIKTSSTLQTVVIMYVCLFNLILQVKEAVKYVKTLTDKDILATQKVEWNKSYAVDYKVPESHKQYLFNV